MEPPDAAKSPESPSRLINAYLQSHSSVFRELDKLRLKGWANVEADKHFQNQRQQADEAGPKQRLRFFQMMCQIGDEMEEQTGAIGLNKPAPSVLDLCAAPGGFIATALRYNPTAKVRGISLPVKLGGHPLIAKQRPEDPRVVVAYLDITMLGCEYGLESDQFTNPGLSSFRPYHQQSFDLVFCDGQVLRTHARYRDETRENLEAGRLSCSQLILAMQRIRQGGTLIMLLHKVESWNALQTLYAFSRFSKVQLFKPKRFHATRSSFYLIARDVQPASLAAKAAVETWKEMWKEATVGLPKSNLAQEDTLSATSTDKRRRVEELLDNFGSQIIQLAEPIWDVQRNALSKKSWTQ